jgi:hypothetical protein
MGTYGGFYFGEKKKIKKEVLEKKAKKASFEASFVLPKVEIVGKKKLRG